MYVDSHVQIYVRVHVCQEADETHRGCPRRAPGASRGTARENRGAVAGMGSGLPGAGQGRGSPGGCAGEVREGVEEGQGMDAGAGSARSRAGAGTTHAGAWWRRPGARRAVGGRSPGAGPASTPDGRSERSSSGCGAAGGGVVAVSTSRSPCLPGGPAGGGAVRFDGEPRHEPGRQGRAGGHERGDHRPLSRPGRGPRRTRPVHDQEGYSSVVLKAYSASAAVMVCSNVSRGLL